MTRKTLVPLLAIAGLGAHAVPVTAQDSQPGDPDAPPLTATLKAPKALTKKQLKKGFTEKIQVALDARSDANALTRLATKIRVKG